MFNIGRYEVGNGRCLIIAEIAQSHNGSFLEALAYIDAVAEAGADIVKFQCHIAAEESSAEEPWRVPIAGFEFRYDYWEEMQFTWLQWQQLAAHTKQSRTFSLHHRDLEFLCSPFSLKALEMLDPLVPAWKVASGEVTNKPLIEAMVKTGKPILLSTGMSTFNDILNALDLIEAGSKEYPFLVFQTTSEYPVPPEDVGLNELTDFKKSLIQPVGLSDHSGSPYTGLAAVALGADALEVHVTWDKRQQGPDVSSSLAIDELKVLVEGTRWIERIRNNPVDKDAMAEKLAPTRALFTRSAFLNGSYAQAVAGMTVSEKMIVMKKPGTGLKLEEVVGRKLVRTVESGTMLTEADFEPN